MLAMSKKLQLDLPKVSGFQSQDSIHKSVSVLL